VIFLMSTILSILFINLIELFVDWKGIMSTIEAIAENILYDLWFSVAETIFERVCEVTQLDEDQREALRMVALRPNDFHIQIIS